MRGYGSHVICFELSKSDVKIEVILKRLEKYMAFFLNKDSVFINSMQFLNSSLDPLVKNFCDDDFKYLTEEFGSENLGLLRQKAAYPYGYMNSFEDFEETELCSEKCFFSSLKKGKIDDNGENILLVKIFWYLSKFRKNLT